MAKVQRSRRFVERRLELTKQLRLRADAVPWRDVDGEVVADAE